MKDSPTANPGLCAHGKEAVQRCERCEAEGYMFKPPEHPTSKQALHQHAMNVLESANWMHECGYRTRGQQLEAAAKALDDAARAADEPRAGYDSSKDCHHPGTDEHGVCTCCREYIGVSASHKPGCMALDQRFGEPAGYPCSCGASSDRAVVAVPPLGAPADPLQVRASQPPNDPPVPEYLRLLNAALYFVPRDRQIHGEIVALLAPTKNAPRLGGASSTGSTTEIAEAIPHETSARCPDCGHDRPQDCLHEKGWKPQSETDGQA